MAQFFLYTRWIMKTKYKKLSNKILGPEYMAVIVIILTSHTLLQKQKHKARLQLEKNNINFWILINKKMNTSLWTLNGQKNYISQERVYCLEQCFFAHWDYLLVHKVVVPPWVVPENRNNSCQFTTVARNCEHFYHLTCYTYKFRFDCRENRKLCNTFARYNCNFVYVCTCTQKCNTHFSLQLILITLFAYVLFSDKAKD